MTAPAPFWMVCQAPAHAGSITAPKVRYATEADAIRAAQSLASERGQPFVVLALHRTVYPTDRTARFEF